VSGKGIGWGKGVWLIFGGFVVFMLGIVAFASMQRFDLVAPDYYAQQIDYQSQIDKNARTARLDEKPRVEFRSSDHSVMVTFPENFDPAQTSGTIQLFRPSNSNYDQNVVLALDADRTQVIPGDKLIPGLYKVKLDWQFNGESFYTEEAVVVQ